MKTHATFHHPIRFWLSRILLALVGLTAVAAAVLFWPDSLSKYASHPHPAADYAQAIQRVDALRSAEVGFNPDCQVILMTHGTQTAKTIVFVHGYTNCPAQFKELGKQFYDRGYNVLIAPLPYHGLADRLTELHARLRAEDLAQYADEVVDIAQGLGEHVTLAGISAGGLVTGWAAQQRTDLDQAVLIAPGFGFEAVSQRLTPLASRLYQLLPNSFTWWDPVGKADIPPDHAYPRYASHALAQILRLSLATQALARQAAPAAPDLLVVTNANDHTVDNVATAKVVDSWRAHGATGLRTYEFPVDLRLGHDLIDVQQPDQNVAVVYARLIELIDH